MQQREEKGQKRNRKNLQECLVYLALKFCFDIINLEKVFRFWKELLMKAQKNKRTVIAVIILTLLVLIGAVYLCSYEISKNLKVEMQKTLHDVAEQNNIAVKQTINSKFQLLYSISQELGKDPDNAKELLDFTKAFVENYGFKRIGYAYPIGMAYTTDGYIQDMSYLDFFQNSMAGKVTITDAQRDITGNKDENVNWLSVPVYGSNRHSDPVSGVLFATYYTKWFEDILDTEAFEGHGYSCIVKTDGEIIAHSSGSPISDADNFFTYLDEEDGQEEREIMQRVIIEDGSGVGSFELDGKQEFYYMPLALEDRDLDWYMVTMVPEAVLVHRLEPIMYNVDMMLLILIVIILSGLSVFFWLNRRRRTELMKLAYVDSLTQGDNFACFQKKMKDKKGQHGYIVAMDLSQFKIINNTCGLECGDKVLYLVWEIMINRMRKGELAARIYADRFVMFLSEDSSEKVRERLDELIQSITKLSGTLNIPRLIPVFGIFETFNQDPLERDYGNALQAKQSVKGRRDCSYAFYEELDYNQVLENREIEDSFEQAIEEKQFEVWYQPKYDAMTGMVVGAEALVRWRKPDGSLLPPFKFIPLFEKNGMITSLDEYVFRTVCEHQKKWEKEGKKRLPVSVNISRVSLYYYNLVEKYKAIIEESNLHTEYVQLEITESATVDNNEIARLLEQFHRAGFHMLLDDFGSGYSSLSTLNRVHFDTLKLDKSLVDYIGDENGEKLLYYITKLAQSMRLHITAEGVETEEQLKFLQDLNCDDIQGYYFSRPLPLDQFEALL